MTFRSTTGRATGLIALAAVLLLPACGGGGGGGNPTPSPTPTPPPATSDTVISGKATYARVPHNAVNGLDYNATFQSPIRGATVQALDGSGVLLDETVSDDQGDYELTVSSGTDVRIRVLAELRRGGAPSWNVTVVDNTSGGALYALDSTLEQASGAAQSRSVEALSGWTGSAYTQPRSAGPFAILDSVYSAVGLLLTVVPQVALPDLTINWSVNNRGQGGDPSVGDIGTSFYQRTNLSGSEIYLLGDANADTDEYDGHVVIHEWGHYLEDRLGRSDSVGGPHSDGDRLDARVAFSEGLGYAFAGMVTGDPNSRDSGGFDQASGFNIDVERNDRLNAGWYSEGSSQTILYDLWDTDNDGPDTVSLGFAPLYGVLTDELADEVALTTLFSYLDALRDRVPGAAAQIDALVAAQDIVAPIADVYGTGETNDAGRGSDVLPLYTAIAADGTPVTVCTFGGAAFFGTFNKLSNRRFLRLGVAAGGNYRLTLTGPAGSDPDFVLHQDGVVLVADSVAAGIESDDGNLVAGDYVLEVYDFRNLGDAPAGRVCLTATVAP